MIRFPQSLPEWGAPEFNRVVTHEVQSLSTKELLLQKGLRNGSVALEEGIEAMVLGSEELPDRIRVRAMIFYKSVIAGCSCADDPTPTDTCDEQCMVQIDIDKATAEATITLIE